MEVPPRLTAGRVLVPVRFVGEMLGAKVAWEKSGRNITITSTGAHQDKIGEVTANLLTANQAEVETDLSGLSFRSFQNKHEEFRDTAVAKQGNSSVGIKSLYSGNQDMSIRTLPEMISISPGLPYTFKYGLKQKQIQPGNGILE